MDNFQASIQSEGKDQFEAAMGIFFSHAPGNKAIGYRVSEEKGIILYWSESSTTTKDVVLFPYEMNLSQAVQFCWGWLENAKYSSQPDHDGDNGKGFCMYNESWGHVDNQWEAFVAIKPVWAMYGK